MMLEITYLVMEMQFIAIYMLSRNVLWIMKTINILKQGLPWVPPKKSNLTRLPVEAGRHQNERKWREKFVIFFCPVLSQNTKLKVPNFRDKASHQRWLIVLHFR